MKKFTKHEIKSTRCKALSLAVGMLFTQTLFAGPFKPIRASATGASSSVGTASSTAVTVAAVRSSSQEGCKQDKNSEKRFPFDLFKDLNPDGAGLKIEVGPDNAVTISSSKLLNVCGGFEPVIGADADGNVAIQMVNKSNKNYVEYLNCLKNDEKLINDKNELDFSKIGDEKFTVEKWVFPPIKVADKNKAVAVYFLNSHRTSSDFPISETTSKWTPVLSPIAPETTVDKADYNCYVPQKIATINQSPEEILLEIQKTCMNGTSREVRDLRGSLGNYNSISGSLDKIRLALDASYLQKALTEDDGVKKIFAQMKTLEDRFIAEKDSLEENAADKLVKQYSDLAVKLNKDFLDPAIAHIDDLMTLREKLRETLDESDQRIVDIDAEIKTLNEKIGEFSKKRPAAYSALLEIEEKYALNDSAKTIADIHAKSFLYSQVYPGPKDSSRGSKKLTFSEAKKQHVSTMKNFEKNLDDWMDAYQVSKGSTYPLKKTEKERVGAITRMNKRWYDYQQSESKKYNQYCGVGWTGSVKNPIQCQAFLKGVDKRKARELKKRDKDLRYIASRNEKLGKMSSNYNEYQKRRVAEADGSEDEDSASDYEASFADTYPEYFATESTPNPYDQSFYNMGVQGNMGNQGMYPQMVNPQMPVQQGQYQLNWPTV